MDAESLQAAAELCRLTRSTDLVAWLGLSAGATPDEARAALERQRKRLQSMQANPKYKEVATFVIKNFRRLDELLGELPAYLDTVADEKTDSQLPLLELAIDGVLADGVLTPEEAAFVRDQAMRLGIAEEVFNKVLRDRCRALGVAIPEPQGPPTVPPYMSMGVSTSTMRVPMRTLHMAHRTAGTGWWDDEFTRLLARQVPPDARRLVDFACGLGWTALSLLPLRTDLEYLGVDVNEMHVEVARRNLGQAGLADRAMVQKADSKTLPLPDGTVDVVTCIMASQQFVDTRPVFRQAARVLRNTGRFIVVEPDVLSQQFWFDGSLPVFNEAFRALAARADALLRDTSPIDDPLGQPSIAIGPHLPARLRACDLDASTPLVHLVQVSQHCTFTAFSRRLRKRIEAMQAAAALRDDDPVLRDVLDVLGRLEKEHDEPVVGTGVHTLPLFMVVGFKE
jgi:SAM-dependent methyltransferase